MDQVRALYPFSGIEENEMVGIEAGDILNVIDKDIGEGWMRVEGPISRPQKEQMDGLIPQRYALHFHFFGVSLIDAKLCGNVIICKQ